MGGRSLRRSWTRSRRSLQRKKRSWPREMQLTSRRQGNPSPRRTPSAERRSICVSTALIFSRLASLKGARCTKDEPIVTPYVTIVYYQLYVTTYRYTLLHI